MLYHTGLPAAVVVNKKSSSQSVSSSKINSDTENQTSSIARSTVSSVENISTVKEPLLPSEATRPKCSKKDVRKETSGQSGPKNVRSEINLDRKRQEFLKFRKQFILQQNEYIDRYAQLRDMEARYGVPASDQVMGEVRVLSVTGWPAHDLLLVAEGATTNEIKGVLGPKILQQITVQLSEIREEVLAMGTELMRRRLEILKFIRAIQRNENRVFVYEGNNIEWQTKNAELDEETVKLREFVLMTVNNLETKLTQSLDAAKIPWMDRDNMLNKIERLQKELLMLKKSKHPEDTTDDKKLSEELQRERAASAKLKEMLASAEEKIAAAARARSAEFERQAGATPGRAKWHNPKQSHRGTHDPPVKRVEAPKSEVTMEALLNQRDALQSKVKELQEHANASILEAQQRETQLKSRVESLMATLEVQEQKKESTETVAQEMEKRLKELQEQYHMLQERSHVLVEAQHKKCLEYLPQKVPCSCEDIDILYDLQATKQALARVKKELERSRAGNDSEKTTEQPTNEMEQLLSEDQTIPKLQNKIKELTENKKLMTENLTRYEKQISALRVEVSLLRSSKDYKSCNDEIPHEELEKQVVDLCLQVERLTREREALASEAMTRTLLLERHERCAELFARVTRARRELAAQIAGASDTTPTVDRSENHELNNVMSKTCLSSANTWSALRVERARVLRLEGVVHAQAQQLDRESQVRIKQDRRRVQLERELLRTWASSTSSPQSKQTVKEVDTLTSDSLLLWKTADPLNIEDMDF